MAGVLGQDERVERIALVDRVLVVVLQLVEGDQVPNREENQHRRQNQRRNVAKGGESKRHFLEHVVCSVPPGGDLCQ